MAGIIKHGDIGLFCILDETFQIAGKVFGVAVGAAHGIEAEIRQQFLDRIGVVWRIGERGKVLILAIADDQRHAAQRFLCKGGRGYHNKGRHQQRRQRMCNASQLISCAQHEPCNPYPGSY